LIIATLSFKINLPGKGAGTDGTDLGIYVQLTIQRRSCSCYSAFYPHLRLGELINGQLHINVTVEAQQSNIFSSQTIIKEFIYEKYIFIVSFLLL